MGEIPAWDQLASRAYFEIRQLHLSMRVPFDKVAEFEAVGSTGVLAHPAASGSNSDSDDEISCYLRL